MFSKKNHTIYWLVIYCATTKVNMRISRTTTIGMKRPIGTRRRIWMMAGTTKMKTTIGKTIVSREIKIERETLTQLP